MADESAITFVASFAPIQSAIQITGNGDGVRIKLDIPESDILPFLHMLALRQTAFEVTITPYETDNDRKPQRKIKY